MNLEEQLKNVENEISKFKFKVISKNNEMMIIEGKIHYKVWFVFFKYYIVCCGDYGEWVFDLPWNTFYRNKPAIPNSIEYLIGKLSIKNNKYVFSRDEAIKNIDDWYLNWKKRFNQEDKKEVLNLIDDFKYNIEKERRISIIDDFIFRFTDLTKYDFSEDYNLYDFGQIIDPNLIVNLVCLKKIKEHFEK